MKASEVLKILRITRPTLSKYVKESIIKVTVLPNGRYDYLSESDYAFLNKDVVRKTVIYARVSTNKQKKDLQNQVDLLKNYAIMNGFQIGAVYQDIASGISYHETLFSKKEKKDQRVNQGGGINETGLFISHRWK